MSSTCIPTGTVGHCDPHEPNGSDAVTSRPNHDIVDRQLTALHRSSSRFVLSTQLWADFTAPGDLEWKSVKFDRRNAAHVPSDRAGVYLFSVKVGVAGLPGEYLMYVGKTTRNFRARFSEYLSERNSPAGRFAVKDALKRWQGHLWFYYAPIADHSVIKQYEDGLIAALIPPLNTDFPASVAQAVSAWRR